MRKLLLGGILSVGLAIGGISSACAQNYATFPPSYQLLQNSATSSTAINAQGGNYYLGVTGTFGGSTLTVQYVLSGVTYTLGSYTVALAAPALVCVPAGAQVSAVIVGGTGVSISAVLAGTGSGPCSDASSGTIATVNSKPYGFTPVTGTQPALAPTTATSLTVPTGATYAFIQCPLGNVQYSITSDFTPTASTGNVLAAGAQLTLYGSAVLTQTQLIDSTGSTATCIVQYAK